MKGSPAGGHMHTKDVHIQGHSCCACKIGGNSSISKGRRAVNVGGLWAFWFTRWLQACRLSTMRIESPCSRTSAM